MIPTKGNIKMKRITHEEYVDWINNNRPDYEVVGTYVNTSTKILHRHKHTNLEWLCSPEKFKLGVSHPKISRVNGSVAKRTHEEYVAWVNNNRPNYEVIGTYVNVKTKIAHCHTETGTEWLCSPEKFMKGTKPTSLTKCRRWTKDDYVHYIKHHKIPVELIGSFTNQQTITRHVCTISGKQFFIAPKRIINNPKFEYRQVVKNTDDYKIWLSQHYPELVITEPYINSHVKINHLHVDTGVSWRVKPNNVIQGQQHPSDRLNGASHRSVEWLSRIAQSDGVEIRHKLNGGEVPLEGIGKVDGFCEATNTVYEFHGDFWHGNPRLFPPEDTNPVIGVPFGRLYDQTKLREQTINQLGYNLVTIWETDYLSAVDRGDD